VWLMLNCRRAPGPSMEAAPSQRSAGLPASLRANASERGTTAALQYLQGRNHLCIQVCSRHNCHEYVMQCTKVTGSDERAQERDTFTVSYHTIEACNIGLGI
jgi:hypothetical protein